MVSQQQAIQMANAFKEDACLFMDMNPSFVYIELLSLTNLPANVSSFATVEPCTNTIYLIAETVSACCERSGFTPLRSEVYAKVRYLYLLKNPHKVIKNDLLKSALAYSSVLMMLKGLRE